METNIIVSVIVPVYNVLPYLKEAIESVVCQSYPYLEIILINDGSSDGSELICEQYALKDKRIRLINQKNMGLSAARNVGLNIMKGEYVAFLDSDDAYHPDFVKIMLNTILLHGTDLVMCKCKTFRSNSTMMTDEYRRKVVPSILPGTYDRENMLRALLCGSINPGVWNKLYKRKLWESIRFPEKYVYEEVQTLFRVLDISKSMFVCKEPLYFYRKRYDGITETYSQKNISDWFLAYSYFDSYVKANIPAIYTDKMLNDSRRQRMSTMIRFYGLYSGDDDYKMRLRSKIIKTEKELGTTGIRFRTRIGLFMLCCSPSLLRQAYRALYFIRKTLICRRVVNHTCLRCFLQNNSRYFTTL